MGHDDKGRLPPNPRAPYGSLLGLDRRPGVGGGPRGPTVWEQRSGRWQAGDQLERDLDHETFVPFNSREYFTTLLGVPAKHRRSPEPLHRAMIRAMWSETLSVPINPVPLKGQLRAAARRVLVATGTLDIAKRIVRGS